MKKFLLDLQMYADEANGTADATLAADAAEPKKADSGTESATAAKSSGEEKKYTDSDLDRVIGKKFAEWKKQEQKAVDEAKKYAEMNAEQKANFERDKAIEERDAAIKERDELKQAAALVEMSKQARKMLADEGINAPDELLAMLVTTSAEATKTNIDSFAKLFNEAKENAIKERLRGEPPRRSSGVETPLSEIDKKIKKYI